ncbi:MAG: hypothetical protein WCW66_02915 [Patescibacteria group bacterium]|jgi:hypothetical protein
MTDETISEKLNNSASRFGRKIKQRPLHYLWLFFSITFWGLFLPLFFESILYFILAFIVMSFLNHMFRRENGKITKFSIKNIMADFIFSLLMILLSLPILLIVVVNAFEAIYDGSASSFFAPLEKMYDYLPDVLPYY